jgi:Stress responsive A/B Barrel Domain
MIHHVVMWRLRDEAKRTHLVSIAEQLNRNVAAMRNAVPGLLRLELATNKASVPDAADLLLYSEFESWHALQGYEVHPLHDELRGLIAPLRIERRVVDYET